MKATPLTVDELLARCYAPRMRQYINGSFMNRFGHTPQDLDDLVQEAVIKMLRQAEAGLEFENEKHFLSYYLNAIFNMYIDRRRSNSVMRGGTRSTRTINYSGLENVEQWMLELSEEPETFQEAEETEAELAVRILAQLPDELRVPLELYVEGESLKEIAARLEMNINTVKGRIRRARELANELREKAARRNRP